MTNLQQFINTWNTRWCDYDGAFGDQCVDLADFFARDVCAAPLFFVPTAADIWSDYPTTHYARIANDPEAVPVPGDIIIWHQDAAIGTGPAGHIGICTDANLSALLAFSQNYPTGSPCLVLSFSYEGVTGWLRPHSLHPAPPPAPAPTPAPQTGPTAGAYALKVDMMLRTSPAKNAPTHGLVKKGAVVKAYPEAHPGWQTHWREIRTPDSRTGWLLASNLLAHA